MDLLTQLNLAMAYVEAHLCDGLTLKHVASVTAYSEYHFCRLFLYIADMPLSEYIRRRKLSMAAMDLQGGRDKVIDLAVKYGYDSADSFTRAFVKQHGVTPTIARKKGVSLTIFPPIVFQIKVEGVRGMNWRIEQKDTFSVIGLSRRFLNDETDKISGFWDESFTNGSIDKLREHAGRSDLIGVCGDMDEVKGDFWYMIGLFNDKGTAPGGFSVVQAPASTWAVFRSEEFEKNPFGEQIPKLFENAYKVWLPTSGYHKVEGRDGEIYDMEIYGMTEAGKFFEEVWISVRKEEA